MLKNNTMLWHSPTAQGSWMYLWYLFYISEHVWDLFFDVVKVFDTMWHSGVTYKMIKLNFLLLARSSLCANFVTEHLPFALPIITLLPNKINDGVPHGSKFDQWLHRNYMRDLPKHSQTSLATMRGRHTLMARNKNTYYMNIHLLSYITYLKIYFKKWRIEVDNNMTQPVFFF